MPLSLRGGGKGLSGRALKKNDFFAASLLHIFLQNMGVGPNPYRGGRLPCPPPLNTPFYSVSTHFTPRRCHTWRVKKMPSRCLYMSYWPIKPICLYIGRKFRQICFANAHRAASCCDPDPGICSDSVFVLIKKVDPRFVVLEVQINI